MNGGQEAPGTVRSRHQNVKRPALSLVNIYKRAARRGAHRQSGRPSGEQLVYSPQWRRNYGDRGCVVPPPQVQDLNHLCPSSQRCGLCQNFKQTTLTTRLYKVRTNLYPLPTYENVPTRLLTVRLVDPLRRPAGGRQSKTRKYCRTERRAERRCLTRRRRPDADVFREPARYT